MRTQSTEMHEYDDDELNRLLEKLAQIYNIAN